MNRRIAQPATLVALLGTLLLAGGCSSFPNLNPFAKKKDVPHREELTAAEWRDLKRENAIRMEGEGIPNPDGKPRARPVGLKQAGEFLRFAFWEFPKKIYLYYVRGETPAKYARMMEDDQSSDARRTGILKLVADYDFARVDPYTKRYWQIAQGDPDSLVRAAAIRAMNRSRDRNGIPVFIKGLDDVNAGIRLESAKALANMPDPKAIPVLEKHLAAEIEIRPEGGRPERVGETRDVRVACADALRGYPDKAVAGQLVGVLGEKDFEVAWQARKSLILMTGHDFRYDAGKWQDYLAKSGNPFGQ